MGILEDFFNKYQTVWQSWIGRTSQNVAGNAVFGGVMALGAGYVIWKSGILNKIIRAIK